MLRFHISKPHQDEGWLVVNLASPSSGLLAGDRVKSFARVESGARLFLTTPSASRIHDASTTSLLRIFPTPYYASVMCISAGLQFTDLVKAMHALHDDKTLWVGCTECKGVA